jgi:hypothetical protein
MHGIIRYSDCGTSAADKNKQMNNESKHLAAQQTTEREWERKSSLKKQKELRNKQNLNREKNQTN